MKLLTTAQIPLLFPILTITALVSNVSLRANEMDDRIEASAKKTYVFRAFLMDDAIKISSNDGGVTLSGTVTVDSHRLLAQDTVQGLPGVKSVDNQIVTKEGIPTRSDGWLRAKVKNTLAFHRNVSATGTTVESKDGTVTLTGKASSQAQKELTTEYTLDVEGVKEVRNMMEVAHGDTDKTPTTTIAEIIDDASITAQVRMALLSHNSTSAIKTKVTASAGVVTLEGAAKNGAERDLVTKLVNDINGVKSLTNRMTLPEPK